MKKILVLVLCLAIAMSSVACNGNTKPNLNEEKLTKLSKELFEKMVTDDYKATVDILFGDVAKKINEDVLREAYIKTVADLGKYIEIKETKYEKGEDSATITIIAAYENNGLKLTYTYSDIDKLIGLYMNYSPIEDDITENDFATFIPILIGNDENQVKGILNMPKADNCDTIAILVQGSGQSDMNETIGSVANAPFKDIADGLAKSGIASIRYNKRYFQYPEKATEEITIHDEVLDDVSAAINFAQNNDYYSFEKIIIIGHSLGGMLAPKIAVDNTAVTKIISLAGSPRSLQDIILSQNKDGLNAITDKTEEEKKVILAQVEVEIEKINNIKQGEKGVSVLGIPSFYWSSLNEIDIEENAKSLTIPMLFLQGKADFQVKIDEDFNKWKDILKDKPNAEFKLYDDLNHLFMKTNGKKDITEYNIKANVDEKVIEDIANWILD